MAPGIESGSLDLLPGTLTTEADIKTNNNNNNNSNNDNNDNNKQKE
jgi:hypothetical protein